MFNLTDKEVEYYLKYLIDLEDIDKGSAEYVKTNFCRESLFEEINTWSKKTKFNFTKDSSTCIIIKYLDAERMVSLSDDNIELIRHKGFQVLPQYLNSIINNDEKMSLLQYWKNALGYKVLLYPYENRFGSLQISSVPHNAKVYLDNIFYGNTELNLVTLAGKHTLGVEMENYINYSTNIEVKYNEKLEYNIRLTKK